MTVPALIGTATLDDNVLVDSLVVDVIDGLRDELHPEFGVRAYRVYRVLRTWTGSTPGQGKFSDVAAELRPYPRVRLWDGFNYVQAVCGVRELGDVKITEVSLSYSESDLAPKVGNNVELFFGIGDANGQGSSVRLWAHKMPPFIDREKDLGWCLMLHRVQSAPPWVPS